MTDQLQNPAPADSHQEGRGGPTPLGFICALTGFTLLAGAVIFGVSLIPDEERYAHAEENVAQISQAAVVQDAVLDAESATGRIWGRHIAVAWVEDREDIEDVLAAGELDQYIGIIVAEESSELGADAPAQECWLYSPEDRVPPTAQSAMSQVKAFEIGDSPGSGGTDWCEYNGVWDN